LRSDRSQRLLQDQGAAGCVSAEVVLQRVAHIVTSHLHHVKSIARRNTAEIVGELQNLLLEVEIDPISL